MASTTLPPDLAHPPRQDPTGGGRPSSTRSIRAASPTPTATGSATSRASPRGCDYLAALGVDAVWLSPFYPSALADGGYDVADYRDVDPRLGTLADFDAMVAALHGAGIRVVVDIVPEPHVEPARVVPGGARGPAGLAGAGALHLPRRAAAPTERSRRPTGSRCSAARRGSASPDGQWYLHFFAVEQPDLNWENPDVREDFVRTLRFWSDRGVDGFRIDVAHMLTKDLTEPLPSQAELDALPQGRQHPVIDRDDVHDIYAEWRAVFNEYDPPRTAVAEAWVERLAPPPLCERRGPRPGVQLRPARRRTSTPRSSAASSRTTSSSRRSRVHRPRHGCCRTTTSCGMRRGTACRDPERDADGRPAAQARQRVAAVGRARARRSTGRRAPAARGPRRSSCSGCPGRPTSTRARSSASTRSRSSTTPIGRTRRSSAVPGSTWGGTDAVCRCPGADRRLVRLRRGRRASAAAGRGSARSPSRCRRTIPDSMLSLYRRALALRQRAAGRRSSSSGSTPAATTCCGSARPGGWEVVTNFGVRTVRRSISRVRCSSVHRRSAGRARGCDDDLAAPPSERS